jgi:hypothetical protein
MKFDHECVKNIFCWVLAWFGFVMFGALFPVHCQGTKKFPTAISLRKNRNFSIIFPQFFAIFWGGDPPAAISLPPPPPAGCCTRVKYLIIGGTQMDGIPSCWCIVFCYYLAVGIIRFNSINKDEASAQINGHYKPQFKYLCLIISQNHFSGIVKAKCTF